MKRDHLHRLGAEVQFFIGERLDLLHLPGISGEQYLRPNTCVGRYEHRKCDPRQALLFRQGPRFISSCLPPCPPQAQYHKLAIMSFASDSCCRFAVRRRWGLWGRLGLRAVPGGLHLSFRWLLCCSAIVSVASRLAPAGCDLSWRLPLLAHAGVLEQRRCTHSCHRVVELDGAV